MNTDSSRPVSAKSWLVPLWTGWALITLGVLHAIVLGLWFTTTGRQLPPSFLDLVNIVDYKAAASLSASLGASAGDVARDGIWYVLAESPFYLVLVTLGILLIVVARLLRQRQ